jgi:predicted nucleic acid-binding protein
VTDPESEIPDARPTVYVETSVISYLAANPSGDVVTRAHQKITREWWSRTSRWELIISGTVMREVLRGNHSTAMKRMSLLVGFNVLQVDSEARRLRDELMRRGIFPPKASSDAEHVAIAAVNGVNYLVTWNLKHIANAMIRARAEAICRECGYEPPVICTPDQMLQEN